MKYRHILFATDLSEGTNSIAKTALEIQERSKAKMSVVHVLESVPVISPAGEYTIPIEMNVEEKMIESARAALAALCSRFMIAKDDQYLATGSPKREILDLANKLKADLIIVGSHGHHGIQLLLGSTANAIVNSAKCDVLAIRIQN